MSTATMATKHDPLASFMAGARDGRRAIPLKATAVEIIVRGGVVVVSTRRVFRNDEDQLIEAVLTFPISVAATLFALEARIGERLLVAKAERRGDAREIYETAIADGQTAILHEEVLRGVHMLSVGPLAPGAEVEVTVRWTASLAFVGGQGRLRIPMTVGEIYGVSPLAESDDLLVGGEADWAELEVRSVDCQAEVLGCTLADRRARVKTDAPIDLVVSSMRHEPLRGATASGRQISLRVTPEPAGDSALSVALLVDRSRSMARSATAASAPASKHELAVAALAGMAPALVAGDEIDLWEFDDSLDRVGHMRPDAVGGDDRITRNRYRALVAQLSEPRGGTEIGQAIECALRATACHDLLLITDGKSHAIDVHSLAWLGRRVSVVLVGEDSLEANVGHLAALTGGELFVVMGADIHGALAAALGSLRMASHPVRQHSDGLTAVRRGARLEIAYGEPCEPGAQHLLARAVAALAAALRLTTLGDEEAALLAKQEGLVTHLTSLVLVDHDQDAVDALPAMRKVALPAPRVDFLRADPMGSAFAPRACLSGRPNPAAAGSPPRIHSLRASGGDRTPDQAERSLRPEALEAAMNAEPQQPKVRQNARDTVAPSRTGAADPGAPSEPGPSDGGAGAQRDDEALEAAFAAVDWDTAASRLSVADLSVVPPGVAAMMLRLAERDDIVAIAERLGVEPIRLVIGRYAMKVAGTSRAAGRVARVIFRGVDPEALAMAMIALDAHASAL